MSTFDKIFGLPLDKYITFICLCLKYYIYVCKFQDKKPTLISFKTFLEVLKDTEYYIAKRRVNYLHILKNGDLNCNTHIFQTHCETYLSHVSVVLVPVYIVVYIYWLLFYVFL